MESIDISNLIDYTEKLDLIIDYLKYITYGIVILIGLSVIKGA